ncbi:PI-actitoxin-Aeq3b-like [Limulus polyphemus]|uniref:PI-actitoxin-Aeq3b-like n=1 Tax=Limulus polyphemus TaxID=6850 RepID=A0ABM1SFA1_LIMPO|nr:PI-actitoxin-Aeq3b-like [Limulus polyphemus]
MKYVILICLLGLTVQIYASKIHKSSRQSNNCDLEPETGPCGAYIPRFYFNKETETCEQFIYGGCGGNRNNFETIEECHEVCKGA